MIARPMKSNPEICLVIPTYNNGGTLGDILERAKRVCRNIIVVNDGCTDGSGAILSRAGVVTVEHGSNRGKGSALKSGFRKAKELGFSHVITMDSDGQHYPEDIPLFLDAIGSYPEAIIVGSRNLQAENMPGGNTFANRFSNFWFRLYTGVKLDDTQTGFRAYPLDRTGGLKLMTSRYEAELELLIFSAWKGTDIRSIPVRVHYPPHGERVSHFRPGKDFIRISILYTVLLIFAIAYALPLRTARLFRKK